jgi:GNAT superfamily N-acetyltransferase
MGSISSAPVRGFQRIDVPEWHAHEARRERAEAVAVERLAGEAGDGGGAAVKIVLADDDLGLVARDALRGVGPAAHGFDGALDGLGAGVHGQHHLHAAQTRQRFAERRQLVVAERARSQRYARRLVEQRLHNARMAMALVEGRVGAQAIEIAAPVDGVHPHAGGALHHHVERAIVVRAPTVLNPDEVRGEPLGIDFRHGARLSSRCVGRRRFRRSW